MKGVLAMTDLSSSIASKAASLGYTPGEYRLFKKHAWILLLTFATLYLVVYGGRLNLGLAIPLMTEQMNWSKTQMGILSSVMFWTYGFGHFFNGRLGEIFGVKRFIMAGAVLSCLANVLISFQDSLLLITILWGFNGYFQSMLWSPGAALLASWWPGNTRGFAYGFHNAFSGLGQVFAWFMVAIAFTLIPGPSGEGDWRAAFTIPVIAILFFVVLFHFLVKRRPSEIGLKEYTEVEPERVEQEAALEAISASKGKLYPYIYLFSQWRFVLWCFIVGGSNAARYGLLTWIPSYYKEVLQMDVKSGIVGSVWLPLGMALGTFIVPWITDKYCSLNRLPAVVICSLLAGSTVLLFPVLRDPFLVAVVLFMAGFFIYAVNGCVWAYASDVGGRFFSGTATGILDWAAYMAAAIQAIIFGIILDTGAWHLLFIVVGGLCASMAVFALIASIGLKKK
jgi:sugar phosphate permease